MAESARHFDGYIPKDHRTGQIVEDAMESIKKALIDRELWNPDPGEEGTRIVVMAIQLRRENLREDEQGAVVAGENCGSLEELLAVMTSAMDGAMTAAGMKAALEVTRPDGSETTMRLGAGS